MDHSTHIRLSPSELNEAVLRDATVYGANDEKIGKISHLHAGGMENQAIIDVGGFLGIGSKPVAVGIDELDFMRDENGDIHAVTSWTKEQLKDMPEHHH